MAVSVFSAGAAIRCRMLKFHCFLLSPIVPSLFFAFQWDFLMCVFAAFQISKRKFDFLQKIR